MLKELRAEQMKSFEGRLQIARRHGSLSTLEEQEQTRPEVMGTPAKPNFLDMLKAGYDVGKPSYEFHLVIGRFDAAQEASLCLVWHSMTVHFQAVYPKLAATDSYPFQAEFSLLDLMTELQYRIIPLCFRV